MKLSNKHYLLILSAVTIILILIIFKDIVIHPNSYLFGPGGDGVKSYYAGAFYIKYDKMWHFTGMNYPYGEHIIYIDNQPIISYVLHLIHKNIFGISDYTVGIFNSLLIFSIIPCVLLLFLILKRYFLPNWYALIASILIGFLSPQFNRFTGHYALSYMFYFPLLWYLLILLFESKKTIIYGTMLSTLMIIFGLIHMYYVAIGAIFVFTFSIIWLFHKYKSLIVWRKKLICGFSCAIIPLIVLKTFIWFTDPVTDRHSAPWGFFHYIASFESVFIPVYSPFLDVWNTFINFHYADWDGNFWDNLLRFNKAQWEGYAYVGFIGLLVLIFSIIKFIKYVKIKNYAKILKPVLPGSMPASLWAGIIILLFSMAYPFKLGFGFLLDWIPGLSQFRSLGRFSWAFYYIFTVYSAFYFYLLFRFLVMKRLKTLAISILTLVLISWAIDSYINVKVIRDFVSKNKNPDHLSNKHYTTWLSESNYSPNDFQAILALPYFNLGSEKLYIKNSSQALFESCKASYDTGLPIAPGWFGRTSISQSFKQAQLISSDLINKDILQDYENDKPLLLITTNEQLQLLEKQLVRKAKLIYQNKYINLYELPLDAFRNNFAKIRKHFNSQKNIIYEYVNYLCTVKTNSVIINNYDDEKAENTLFGNGALFKKEGNVEIYNGIIPTDKDTTALRISLWFYSFSDVAAFPILHYKQYDKEGQIIDMADINPKYSTENFKNWVRVEHNFNLYNKNNRLDFIVEGKNILIDELIIAPINAHVYTHIGEDGSFVADNYFIPKE